MIRNVAIPFKFFDRKTRQLRTDLTEEEQQELAKYGPQPLSEDEIAAKLQSDAEEELRVQQEAEAYALVAYRDQRRAAYPPIGDQLDAIMKWLSTENEFNIPAELKSIAMTCMSVKSQYPKPEAEE